MGIAGQPVRNADPRAPPQASESEPRFTKTPRAPVGMLKSQGHTGFFNRAAQQDDLWIIWIKTRMQGSQWTSGLA